MSCFWASVHSFLVGGYSLDRLSSSLVLCLPAMKALLNLSLVFLMGIIAEDIIFSGSRVDLPATCFRIGTFSASKNIEASSISSMKSSKLFSFRSPSFPSLLYLLISSLLFFVRLMSVESLVDELVMVDISQSTVKH